MPKHATANERPESLLSLPSENEPGAVEVQRETTEAVTQRRVREVVRYEPALGSIPREKLTDPVIVQVLLDERDYWLGLVAERDESIAALEEEVKTLTQAQHNLDMRCALAEDGLRNATRTIWVEGALLAIGGGLFSAGISPHISWANLLVGLALVLVAILSGFYRWRNSAREGAR